MRVAVEPSLRVEDYPFSHRLRVRFAETDAMGVVHHGRYLPYLEAARVEFLRHLGHPYTAWRENGIDATVLEVFMQYRQPLRFDDVVDVHVRLASVTRTTFQMGYLLTREATPVATGVTVHGAVTADGRATRLPAWLVELGRVRPPSGRQGEPTPVDDAGDQAQP
jgi:acyl-CoA thioester hydrolase